MRAKVEGVQNKQNSGLNNNDLMISIRLILRNPSNSAKEVFGFHFPSLVFLLSLSSVHLYSITPHERSPRSLG